MVGLVLVSHSRNLAAAASQLAQGVSKANLPIAHAGGTGENHQELGTDATDIMEAIQNVNQNDGVLILMDLGSAVLSSRMAAELLDGEVPNIQLCPAPLVEGAVAAAIQIATGADIANVIEEAKTALAAKNAEMTPEEEQATAQPKADADEIPPDALHCRFTIADPNGMHTRPAAMLAKGLAPYKMNARIRNFTAAGPYRNARSLNQIALAGIGPGDNAEIALWGEDAAAGLKALQDLLAGDLAGQEISPETPAGVAADRPAEPEPARLIALAPGLAAGRLYLYESRADTPPRETKTDDPEGETAKLDAALTATREHFLAQKETFAAAGKTEAAILSAQLLILDDPELLGEIRADIRQNRRSAASAYHGHLAALAESYRGLASPYLRERAADIRGVAEQVLARLAGKGAVDRSALQEVIIYADEVTPTQIGEWAPGQLRGILTRQGGTTSHVAILAKALGLPALMGVTLPDQAKAGDQVFLDAKAETVSFNPGPSEAAAFAARRQIWAEAAARDARDCQGPAISRDGVAVPIYANVGDAATAAAAAKGGAEGIGLLRTEFLFLDRRTAPTEDEQVERLGEIMRHFRERPVTVRTLDAGGDKPMPWLNLAPEANPFLGVRGVRLSMAHRDLFKTQLRAILRAGAADKCRLEVMTPMVATLAEVEFFLDALQECHAELAGAGAPHAWPVKRGIMLETPAAVLQAAVLAERVDFFSIGSNDLTQYVMCAERGGAGVLALSDGMHPAVLRAIEMISAAAKGAGKSGGVEVAVCGEMAADPVSAQALLALGVDVLSLNAPAIAAVKRTVRGSSLAELRKRAERIGGCDRAEQTRELFTAD